MSSLFKSSLVISMSVLILSGCASGINGSQKAELETYSRRGLAVEEKNTTAAMALGLLPGGGSFYSREYGLGVVNLIFWPLSIFWDPFSGYNASEKINYVETKAHVEELKNKEIADLNEKKTLAQIDDCQYQLAYAKIRMKYEIVTPQPIVCNAPISNQ